MPATRVHIYAEQTGKSPVVEWLREVGRRNTRALDACIARVKLLAAMGHELRRPHADMLRDGVYELRARVGRVSYRLLYFFHARNIAVVVHGFTKEGEVPAQEIERAIERRRRYEQSPAKHQATIDL